MEEPFDDHGHEVPLSVMQLWRGASPLWTLLRAIDERPGTWDLDLL
jgi:hypothetical protein